MFVSFRKMAIVGLSNDGFLVDHKKSISDSVSELSLSCKDCLFALFEPYFRSSVETGRGTRKRKVSIPGQGFQTPNLNPPFPPKTKLEILKSVNINVNVEIILHNTNCEMCFFHT